MDEAKEYYLQQKYKEASENLEAITKHNFADDKTLGAAYLQLFLCYREHKNEFAIMAIQPLLNFSRLNITMISD